MRDPVNEPLTGRAPPPGAQRRGGSLALLSAAAVLALGAGGYAWLRAPDRSGASVAARIETAPPAPPPSAPVAVSPAPASGVTIAAGSDVEAASGVKVVRNGGGSATGALIIDVGQSLSMRLPPAPDPRLVEKSRFGPLPRIGPDGARPSEVYARPVLESAGLKNAPRIAILVGGLGLDASSTSEAVAKLPAAVSLGFAPYGGELERDAAAARAAGHEILLQAPMEPFGTAASESPHMLLTGITEAENRDALHWQMGRFPGYVGIANYLGGRLTSDAQAFSPLLADIASRGLVYLDDGSSPRSLARDLAGPLNLKMGVADVVIDAAPTAEAIEAALARLETVARRQDVAIGVATALPLSIDHIARWAASLEARGIALEPVSALIARGPAARSARATP